MRALAEVLSRRLALRQGLAAAVALTATLPLSRRVAAAQEEKLAALGGRGQPQAHAGCRRCSYGAQCIIEDNPEAFSVETYSMGKVIIDPHRFFMAMYANEVSLVSIRDLGDCRRVAKLTSQPRDVRAEPGLHW